MRGLSHASVVLQAGTGDQHGEDQFDDEHAQQDLECDCRALTGDPLPRCATPCALDNAVVLTPFTVDSEPERPQIQCQQHGDGTCVWSKAAV